MNRAWDLFISDLTPAGSARASAQPRTPGWQNAVIHQSSITEQLSFALPVLGSPEGWEGPGTAPAPEKLRNPWLVRDRHDQHPESTTKGQWSPNWGECTPQEHMTTLRCRKKARKFSFILLII